MMVRPDLDDATLLAASVDALAQLENPERVTVAGDFHGERGWARYVLRAAKSAGSSVVVQLGDFGIWGTDQPFLDEVERWAAHTGVVVLFVDGNHEDFDHLEQYPLTDAGLRVVRPHVLHAPRGTRWVWKGMTWLALGGAVSVDRDDRTHGIDWWPQETLTTGQVYRASMAGPADIMLTHDCPTGIDIPGLDDPAGWPALALADSERHRDLLRVAVDAARPTHLFHGHYHVRYTAELDLGGGLVCQVEGLDRDQSMSRGFVHLDLDVLAAQSWAARARQLDA